jgi:YegS/Rv2252/BmrU family lipid kinase
MLHFIVNIKSGKGKALSNIRKITDYLTKRGIEYSMHVTRYPHHGEELARKLSLQDGATIVAMGGDGTFHEVLNGIGDLEKVRLGFIPCGRGNDFARAAGFNKNPIKALEDILRGEETRFDYINVGSRRCLNVAGTGMDVDVLLRVDGSQKKLTYLKSLIACLAHFEPYKVTATVNGETKEFSCLVAAVCNGIAFGGDMKVSPDSKIDDGVLDLRIITMPKGSVWGYLPKFVSGKHVKESWSVHYKCESAKITASLPVQLDGEIYKDLPMDCSIVKGGIRTFKIKK